MLVVIITIFDSSHSNGCEVVSHCDFDYDDFLTNSSPDFRIRVTTVNCMRHTK